MGEYSIAVLLGVIFGFGGRLVLLKNDYRQYPTHPHGALIHLTLGLIAAGLGSIAIPALLEEEYAAITFLALAAQHFREVRTMERETLTKMDQMELVSRGSTYIEGIAMTFEGRNYMVILIASITTFVTIFSQRWWLGILVGVLGVAGGLYLRSGKQLGQVAQIVPAIVHLDGAEVYVDDIHIMNVGMESSRRLIEKQALGVILKPNDIDSLITLSNLGQRQAILHDLSVGLGVYRDDDKPSLTPLARRDLDDGRVAIFFLPQVKNMDKALDILARVPVLENAVRVPSESDAHLDQGGFRE